MTAAHERMVTFFRQKRGAIDHNGGPMDPGWYWVALRPTICCPPGLVPFGANHGPFLTKTEARNAYRRREA